MKTDLDIAAIIGTGESPAAGTMFAAKPTVIDRPPPVPKWCNVCEENREHSRRVCGRTQSQCDGCNGAGLRWISEPKPDRPAGRYKSVNGRRGDGKRVSTCDHIDSVAKARILRDKSIATKTAAAARLARGEILCVFCGCDHPRSAMPPVKRKHSTGGMGIQSFCPGSNTIANGTGTDAIALMSIPNADRAADPAWRAAALEKTNKYWARKGKDGRSFTESEFFLTDAVSSLTPPTAAISSALIVAPIAKQTEQKQAMKPTKVEKCWCCGRAFCQEHFDQRGGTRTDEFLSQCIGCTSGNADDPRDLKKRGEPPEVVRAKSDEILERRLELRRKKGDGKLPGRKVSQALKDAVSSMTPEQKIAAVEQGVPTKRLGNLDIFIDFGPTGGRAEAKSEKHSYLLRTKALAEKQGVPFPPKLQKQLEKIESTGKPKVSGPRTAPWRGTSKHESVPQEYIDAGSYKNPDSPKREERTSNGTKRTIPAHTPGVIYLISDGFGFKIGFTTGSAFGRSRGLQTGTRHQMRPLGSFAAVFDDESKVHDLFKHLRGCGEHFAYDESIIEYFRERIQKQIAAGLALAPLVTDDRFSDPWHGIDDRRRGMIEREVAAIIMTAPTGVATRVAQHIEMQRMEK